MRRRALRMLARRSAASSSVQVISSSTVKSRSVIAGWAGFWPRILGVASVS